MYKIFTHFTNTISNSNKPYINNPNTNRIEKSDTNLVFKRKPLAQDTISFGYSFFLKNHPHMHCAYCSREMLTIEQINEFKETLPEKKGNTALYYLLDYTEDLRGNERAVARILASAIKQNPNKTVAELIKTLAKQMEPRLLHEQISICNEILSIAKQRLPKEKYVEVEAIFRVKSVDQALKLSTSKRSDFYINKLKKLQQATTSDSEKQTFEEMIEIAIKKLSASKNSAQAFIVKYGKRSPQEFLEHLVDPLSVTADHIHPNVKGGGAESENLLLCCGKCNWDRGDIEFAEWVAQKPERMNNIEKHLAEVEALFGKKPVLIKRYGNYPVNVRERIAEQLNKPKKLAV